MDHSMALRCILQRSQASVSGPRGSEDDDDDEEDDSGAKTDAASLQKYALIPNSVTVANLLEFVLRQLDIKEAVSDCKANIVLPGWKTLALKEICSNTESTSVVSLLGNVSNIAVLRIKLPVALPPPMPVVAIQRLMRALLPKHTDDRAVQVDWLVKSGCPMGESDLIAYLSASERFVFTESTRVNFAVWRRHLRRLAAQAGMDFQGDDVSGCADFTAGDPTTVEGGKISSSSMDEDRDVSTLDTFEAPPNEESWCGDNGEDWDAEDDSQYSAQASLERLSYLSRVPRHHGVDSAAGKENCGGFGGGVEASTTFRGQAPSSTLAMATAAAKSLSLSSLALQVPPPRHRLFICPHAEIPILETHFATNAHPDATECRRIAEQLNSMPFRSNERRQMQAKNVRLWFKNRRARARKGDPVAPSSKAVAAAAAAAAAFSPAAGASGGHHHPLLLPLLPQPPTLLAKPALLPPQRQQLLQIRLPMLSGVSGSSAAASG